MTLKGSRQLLGLARASTAGVGLAAEQLGRQTPAQPAQLLPAAQRLLFTGSGEQGQQPGAKAGPWAAAAAGVAAALGLATFASSNSSSMPWAPRTALAEAKPKSPAAGAATAPAKKALPVYSAEEVSKHKTKEQRIWVTFKDGVYDITEFIAMHPGGAQRIMLAAGGPVEPFWAMYQQHMKAEVQDILAEYKIGTLAGGAGAQPAAAAAGGDVWANEPQRHPALVHRSSKPCNAETPAHILAGNLITPTELFYVRNHLPVPPAPAEPGKWVLRVGGEGLKEVSLSVDDLKRNFRKHEVAATVQCAGNRRNEMKQVKPVKGLDWDGGAIGTAVWGGVLLRDVLIAAGLDPEAPGPIAHIHFVGADKDPLSGDAYGASVPIDLAAGSHREVLLAYEMNGAPLTRDHGAPLRVVVPGVVGARSVKWLTQIVASRDESPSFWQQRDYKAFCPSVDWDTVDWGSAPAIADAPVTSAITEPAPGTQLPAGSKHVTIKGYAWSGAGREVVRVDVSSDGGKTWEPAELKKLPQRLGRAWAWSLWEATVPLPKGTAAGQTIELVARAVDSSYNSQPDSVAAIWNLRGVVNNAWHRVRVEVAKA